MRLSIITAGTRGDVAPLATLGRGLRLAGHQVRLATHASFRALVERQGLEFELLPGAPEAMFSREDWQRFALSPWRPRTHARILFAAMSSLLEQIAPEDYARAAAGADAVIFTPTTGAARPVAEELGLAVICATLTPLLGTSAFPHPIAAPGLRLGVAANRLSHLAGDRLTRAALPEPLRPGARRAVGLSPSAFSGRPSPRWPPFPVVGGYSPALVPRPLDWPAHVEVCGFWTDSSPATALPAAVQQFIDAGAPPLLVTFGSMRPADPARLATAMTEALRRSGWRAIVQGDWLPAAAAEILVTGELAHPAVMGQVAGVVHHGGAGTLAAGLRAGRPTLVMPFVYDQAFWGHRVASLGAGPRPLPAASVSPAALARALGMLRRPAILAAAEQLGGRLREEDGVGAAVRAIERRL